MSLHSPKTLGFSTLPAELDIVDNINYCRQCQRRAVRQQIVFTSSNDQRDNVVTFRNKPLPGPDEAACDAIHGMFDATDIRGEIMIGEGIKDQALGLFAGERVGW